MTDFFVYFEMIKGWDIFKCSKGNNEGWDFFLTIFVIKFGSIRFISNFAPKNYNQRIL